MDYRERERKRERGDMDYRERGRERGDMDDRERVSNEREATENCVFV